MRQHYSKLIIVLRHVDQTFKHDYVTSLQNTLKLKNQDIEL